MWNKQSLVIDYRVRYYELFDACTFYQLLAPQYRRHFCDWLQSPITVTIIRSLRSVIVVAFPVLEDGAAAL